MGAASPSDRSVRVLYTVAAPRRSPSDEQVAISLWGRPADSGAGAELGISGVVFGLHCHLIQAASVNRVVGMVRTENALLSSEMRGWRGVLPYVHLLSNAPNVERARMDIWSGKL